MSFPRYPKYKDIGVEWLGEVPERWEVSKLKRVVNPERQITYGIVQAGPHSPDGIPYIRPADMTDEHGIVSLDDILRTSTEIASCYSRSTIRAGDLVCSIGPSFGKVMVVPSFLDGANLTQGTARVSVQKPHHARYVFWTLRSPASVAQWESSVGGATFRALNLGPLAETSILLPSENEQIQIAAFLDRETAKIDQLVAEQRRLMELLKEKRQAVISHAVTKGLNPHAPLKHSGIEWLGEVPAHWEIKRLKNVAARLQGRLIVQPQLYFADDGVPIVFGYNIKDGVIDEAGLSRIDYETDRKHAHAKARAGDLFTVRLGDPGKTTVVPKSLDGCHFASIMWIHQDERFHSAWLSHCMNSAVVQRQIEAVNYGAAQTQFNIRDAVDFRLPVPPLEEQRQIAAAVDEQLDEIDTLSVEAQRSIDLLQERRTALISAAVTGQIDVRALSQGKAA